MAKLFCSKISHNPYKEEMVTEIPERVFEIDGYQIAVPYVGRRFI